MSIDNYAREFGQPKPFNISFDSPDEVVEFRRRCDQEGVVAWLLPALNPPDLERQWFEHWPASSAANLAHNSQSPHAALTDDEYQRLRTELASENNELTDTQLVDAVEAFTLLCTEASLIQLWRGGRICVASWEPESSQFGWRAILDD